MHTQHSQNERRRQRSTETQVAMTYQLEHVREKYGFLAVVLADGDGFYFAGSEEQGNGEAIAAYADAIVDAQDDKQRARMIAELKAAQFGGRADVDVRVHEFGLANVPAYLAIVSTASEDFDRAANHAVKGITRIFATT